MKNYKLITSYMFGVIFVFILFMLVSLAIYLYDPEQIFKEQYPKHYKTFTGLATKRLIDNHDFTCVMLGSSMMTGSSQYELKEACLNLSIPASTWNGRAIVLKYLLENKNNIKNIITTYDGFYEHSLERNDINFVFNKSKKDKFKFYFKSMFGGKYIKCLYTFSKEKDCIGSIFEFNLNRHDEYLREEFNQEVENIINEILIEQTNKYSTKTANENIKYFNYSYKKINSFIVLISKYKKVNFHIVIPPYPTYNVKKRKRKFNKFY